jgi:energy-coupling factor transporter ATP-binding protein EcfA2
MNATELESILGTRGYLAVTSDNRATIRKWLTAQGLPSLFVGALAMKALEGAYNDATGRALERLRVQAADATANDEPAAPRSPDGMQPQAIASPPIAPTATAAPDQNRIAAIVAAVVGALPPAVDMNAIESRVVELVNARSMTPDAIKALIESELPRLIPTTRIEIKTPAGIKTLDPAPRHKQLKKLVEALSTGLHVALVGPAGSGKTTAVEQAAAILESDFYIQGAIQGAWELTGVVGPNGDYRRTPTRDAFELGGYVCWDEMDAGDPAGMLVANSATANGYMAFPDQTKPVRKHDKFQAIACMNTYGRGADRVYVGRSQMDGATLDRFVFLSWEYDERLELAIAGNDVWTRRVQELRHGAEKINARVVISPRASIYGAKLLAAGWNMSEVEESTIWKGTPAAQRIAIENAARLA